MVVRGQGSTRRSVIARGALDADRLGSGRVSDASCGPGPGSGSDADDRDWWMGVDRVGRRRRRRHLRRGRWPVVQTAAGLVPFSPIQGRVEIFGRGRQAILQARGGRPIERRGRVGHRRRGQWRREGLVGQRLRNLGQRLRVLLLVVAVVVVLVLVVLLVLRQQRRL